MGSISRDSTFNRSFDLICTREDPTTFNPINFIPEVEYGVIRDSVSHILDRPLVNTSSIVWRYSIQNKTPTPTFQIGDCLRYTNEIHNEMVELAKINTNDAENTNYIIKFLLGNTNVITKEFLKSRNIPDIASVKIHSQDNIN